MNSFIVTIKFLGRKGEVERPIRVQAGNLMGAASAGSDICRGYFIGSGLNAEIVSIRKDHGRAETYNAESIHGELNQ